MARLVVSPGTPQAREVMLKPGINTIGRHEDNDLPIPDPSISEAHCQIIVSEGGVRLRDLGSTNGTFVNAARVTETELQAGQQFQLGGVHLLFQAEKQDIAVAAPTPAFARLRVSEITTHSPPAAVADPELTLAEEHYPKVSARSG